MTKKTKPSRSIAQWAAADKPREKLLEKGKLTLTVTELLAIILRTGAAGKSALDLSRDLMQLVNHDFHQLGLLRVGEMTAVGGIGKAKAATVIAALELGRRHRIHESPKRPRISDSRTAFELFKTRMGTPEHEEFWVLYLNNAHTVLFCQQLSKGGIAGTLVDIRLVLKKALELSAVAMILAHNHPSGVLKPSPADIKLTKKMKAAAIMLDLKVLDHLILSNNDYFSFADAQMLH